ncbi:beta-1,3-galactosyl-O-glycosyl-glycoprotein beta-1,6-N-acetylglucosaminyltransferase 4-like [Clinocottus analis]|uniref:beta-1,3-galactosyl-O-glycosyl-glycoprotein beta-1,6-N-acetylglucosaminyltransferase 4-like n=1 Tax=Clinocottus analis TaxID=304258 RepID=UPI0035BFC291
MKARCPLYSHRLRHRCFLFSLSLLAVCLLKLVHVKVTVRGGVYIQPYGGAGGGYDVNCTAVYELDPVEIGKTLAIKRRVVAKAGANTDDVDDESTVALTSDCRAFVRARGYDAVPASEAERAFPLAYSLVVHKNAPMVERILRAVYAPHNVYCVHYDQKSSPAFIKAVRNLARCAPNVFVASKLESVEYAHVSRLNADLNCLRDLRASEVRWRYVINLCGQDFPLKSNRELVAELTRLNGSNMLESSRPSKLKRQRFGFRHELRSVPYEYRRIPVKTAAPKDAPPHGIEMFIGSAYFVLSREFVDHVAGSPVAKDFLAWSADTYSPDEHFWATLVRVPGVPGHIPRSEADVTDLKSKTRLVKWNYLEGNLYPACTGAHMRSVCIYGAAELRWLLNYGHWFANKFDPKVDPVLITCLEEKLLEKRKYAQT